MDASALVKNVDTRPTLGRVGVGPLGGVHTDMLEEILNSQRRKNPLKRFNDACQDCFICCFNCLGSAIPTRVSPELAFEKKRPLRSEIAFLLLGMFAVSCFGVIFLGSAISSSQVGSKWHGPTTCLVKDYVTEEVGALNKKLLMKVYPGDNKGVVDYFATEIAKNNKQGSPYSCAFNKSSTDSGPCCHSNFGVYKYQVGDSFPCYFTTDTSYCNNIFTPLVDDDFRGLGPNPSQGQDDRLNSLCCEPSVPTNYTGILLPLILSGGCCAVTLWCLLFRWKKGVWHRLCPTADYPPVQAHAFDTKLDNKLSKAEMGALAPPAKEEKKVKAKKKAAGTVKKPSTPPQRSR